MTYLYWDKFSEKYKPIKNTFEKDPPCDGHLFEDRDLLKRVKPNNIWSLIDNNDGEEMFITNGLRIINCLGYLISIENWKDGEEIEVRLGDGYEIKK